MVTLSCTCAILAVPLFSETPVLFRSRDQNARELKEAYVIKRRGRPPCLSGTPLSLVEGKIGYLSL